MKKKVQQITKVKNAFYAWLKADTCRSKNKRDIHVQKVKVEKILINTYKFAVVKVNTFLSFTIKSLDRGKIRLLFDALFVM